MPEYLIHLTSTPNARANSLHGHFRVKMTSWENALAQSKSEFSQLAKAYYNPPAGMVITSYLQSGTAL